MVRRPHFDDHDGERWLFLWFAVPLAVVLTLAMVLEWTLASTWWLSMYPSTGFSPDVAPSVWVTSLVPTLLGIVALLLVYPTGKPWWWRTTLVLLVSLLVLPLRLAVQVALWGAVVLDSPWALDLAVGSITAAATLGLAVYLAGTQMAAVRAERLAAQHEYRSRQVALELENEELRVRREVSDVLHGRIQQRLVFLASELESLVPKAEAADDEASAKQLRGIIDDLDHLREDDVRDLSHSLLPAGVGLGLAQALALQVSEVPPQVRVDVEIDPDAAAIDDVTNPQLDLAKRLLLVHVLEEGITNAIKHGSATELLIQVRLGIPPELTPDHLMIAVVNNGQLLEDQAAWSGLSHLKRRAQQHGGDLDLASVEDGRTRLRAWIRHKPTDHTKV